MFPRKPYRVPLPGGRALELGPRTLVMGVLNVTPDSFADGGRHLDAARALAAARDMQDAGADLIDVGAESTRPGADPLPVEAELARLLPVLDSLTGVLRVPLSVDTSKAAVAAAALARGAAIINDISSLRYDPALAGVAAEGGAALVLMHHRGGSREMYRKAVYADLVGEMAAELSEAMDRAGAAGIARDRIILDPGIGFAKRAEHSYAVLAQLDRLAAALDRPLVAGPSRKSFLTVALGERPPDEREWGTAAAVAAAVLHGAHIVRVHGVREMIDVVRVADLVRTTRGRFGGEPTA